MHQRIPVTARFAAEGFGGSKFTPIRSIGAPVGPVDLAVNANGNGTSPSPTPAPAPAPAPDVIVRPTPFFVPPAVQYPEPVYVTETPAYSDDTKTLITVAAAVGLVALGAVLF